MNLSFSGPKCSALIAGLAIASLQSSSAELTHHYRLDETFQHEVIANGVGSLIATSTPVMRGHKGVVAGGFELSELDNDFISLGANNAVLPPSDFTVTMWVRFSADGGDENERLFDFSNGDAFTQTDTGVNLKVQGGWLRAFIGDGTNKVATGFSSEVLAKETWYLMALRHQVSSNPGVANDGSVQLTALAQSEDFLGVADVLALTENTTHSLGSPASVTDFRLGASPTGLTELKSFDGLMDEVRIYDHVLSDQELAELHNEQVTVSSSLRWIFNINGDEEGWTGSGLSTLGAADGNLVATSAGNDPYVLSPDNLALDLTSISKVFFEG